MNDPTRSNRSTPLLQSREQGTTSFLSEVPRLRAFWS